MIQETKFYELISGAQTLSMHGLNGSIRHTETFYRNNKHNKWLGGSLFVVKNNRITDVNETYVGKTLARKALFNRLKRICESEPHVYIDVDGRKLLVK